VSATTDLATAREWIGERFAPGGPAEFFLSPTRFVSCERTPDSWSMTLSGEQCYGLGFGPAPPINPEWTRCSIDQSRLGERVGQLVARDAWDFYSLDTSTPRAGSKPPVVVETVSDDAAIERILRAHAPHSQVWPGNAEVANWYGVRGEAGQWASIAALVRWESGSYVLASIATVVDLRGRGYVRQLLRGVVDDARRRHISWLGLGVAHDNAAAKRSYERVGFELRANFTSYARLND
jgi:ribosomal protein S18 acetylase RimI-like enzyme